LGSLSTNQATVAIMVGDVKGVPDIEIGRPNSISFNTQFSRDSIGESML
jgi:hypothetical protein